MTLPKHGRYEIQAFLEVDRWNMEWECMIIVIWNRGVNLDIKLGDCLIG